MREHRKMLKELNEENRKIYFQTRLFLCRDVKNRRERKAVLNDFLEVLSDAQIQGISSEALFPEGYDAFYSDLLSGLAVYPASEKRKRILWVRAAAICFFVFCVGTILIQYLTAQGYIGVWTEGINYIATDFNNYTYEAAPVREKVSFEIDFRRWKEYKNVVVFRSGDITVELENLDETDGRYRIFFRAHGAYSRDGAVLVSWRKYAFDESHIAVWKQTGELFCDYGGESYACHLLGFTNLNFKDGETFSFYVPDVLSPGTPVGVAEFHLRNLMRSVWKRRSEIPVKNA